MKVQSQFTSGFFFGFACSIAFIAMILSNVEIPTSPNSHAEQKHQEHLEISSNKKTFLNFTENIVFWTVVAFLLSLSVLSKYAWTPMKTALDARQKKIQNEIAMAKNNNQKSEILLLKQQELLEQAYIKANQITQEAQQQSKQFASQKEQELKFFLEKEEKQFFNKLKQQESEFKQNMLHVVANLAISISENIMKEKAKHPDIQEKWLKQNFDKLKSSITM